MNKNEITKYIHKIIDYRMLDWSPQMFRNVTYKYNKNNKLVNSAEYPDAATGEFRRLNRYEIDSVNRNKQVLQHIINLNK